MRLLAQHVVNNVVHTPYEEDMEKCQHNRYILHPAGSGAATAAVGGAARGYRRVPVAASVPVSSPSRADCLPGWPRQRQNLNYLTDVSLASAADPVAERRRGAEEHGAPRGWRGVCRRPCVLFPCAVSVMAQSTSTQPPHYTPVIYTCLYSCDVCTKVELARRHPDDLTWIVGGNWK